MCCGAEGPGDAECERVHGPGVVPRLARGLRKGEGAVGRLEMSGRDVLWVVVAVLGVLLLIPVLGMAFWGWGWMMGPGMMGPGMMTRWGWGGGWGGLLGLVVLLLLVAGVALVVLGLSRRETQDTALDILRQRLARGEITPEQYEELKKLLR
jgi:putative membrane protein